MHNVISYWLLVCLYFWHNNFCKRSAFEIGVLLTYCRIWIRVNAPSYHWWTRPYFAWWRHGESIAIEKTSMLLYIWKHRHFAFCSSPIVNTCTFVLFHSSILHLASRFFTDTYAEAISLFYWHLRWLTLRLSPFFTDTYAEAVSLFHWHLRSADTYVLLRLFWILCKENKSSATEPKTKISHFFAFFSLPSILYLYFISYW